MLLILQVILIYFAKPLELFANKETRNSSAEECPEETAREDALSYRATGYIFATLPNCDFVE